MHHNININVTKIKDMSKIKEPEERLKEDNTFVEIKNTKTPLYVIAACCIVIADFIAKLIILLTR
jgi:hypothetical protein